MGHLVPLFSDKPTIFRENMKMSFKFLIGNIASLVGKEAYVAYSLGSLF